MFFVASGTIYKVGFTGGKLAVDCFFVLSGFFLINSFRKYNKNSCLNNFACFAKKRIMNMGSALIVGLLFSTLYFILFPSTDIGSNYIFGYLWYVPLMFIGFVYVYIFFKNINNNKVFILVMITTSITCYLCYFMFGELRIFSPFAGICLGVAISYIPISTSLAKNQKLSILLSVILFLLCFALAYIPNKYNLINLLIIAIYATFLYCCQHFNFYSTILNYLGKISFGLYALQTIPRVLRDVNILHDNLAIFTIILCSAIICNAIDALINKSQTKKYNN